MKADEFKDILYEKEEETGIVTVTMNTPKRKNALSGIS
ncbi:MAG: enoyl-CoA hydratase, partial [Proteobacteria bacterium]|nr:enoyl-CoA hydratase [Pseudomonadota bacterium]